MHMIRWDRVFLCAGGAALVISLAAYAATLMF